MLSKRDRIILQFIGEFTGITIKQIGRIFFKGEYKYDSARIKLKNLYNQKLLSRYTFENDTELIYCLKDENKRISKHDYYNMEFYSMLANHGADIIKYKKERVWESIGKKRTDGFFEFVYNDEVRLICLEVDFTHMTNIKEKYLALYNTGNLQNEYNILGDNIFPKVVIMTYKKTDIENIDYPFEVTFINFDLDNFVEKVLI